MGGTIDGRDIAGVAAPPPLLYLAPLLAGLAIHRRLPAPLSRGRFGRPAGWGLVVAGIGLELWFLRAMTRAATPFDPRRPTRALVTDGPFAFSRNPGYVAFTLIYLGASGIANSAWPLALLPVTVLGLRRGVIDREEAYLERLFGDEYRRYRERVPRWL